MGDVEVRDMGGLLVPGVVEGMGFIMILITRGSERERA